jgi:hypothetical protein|tara:strand:+ start:1403 stop:1600 length:198 start_codon:yes stop_codon:yes gene_type:complete
VILPYVLNIKFCKFKSLNKNINLEKQKTPEIPSRGLCEILFTTRRITSFGSKHPKATAYGDDGGM